MLFRRQFHEHNHNFSVPGSRMNAKIREEGKKKRKKNGKMRCVQKSEKEEAGGAENGGS